MNLSDEERAMLDGRHGEALRRSTEGLVQLGEAFGAEDMVRIGYAHVHPGMALYAQNVELLEELVRLGAKVSVPTSANVTNVDSDNWKLTGAPEKLVRVHRRGVRALADQEGITAALRGSGAKIITDTCPMSCHFARTTSPDPGIELPPPPMRVMVVDSAKQAKYVRDMIRCKTLLTCTAAAVETAVTGRFVPRRAA